MLVPKDKLESINIYGQDIEAQVRVLKNKIKSLLYNIIVFHKGHSMIPPIKLECLLQRMVSVYHDIMAVSEKNALVLHINTEYKTFYCAVMLIKI